MKTTSCHEEPSFSIKCLPARTTQQRNKGGFYFITLELLKTYCTPIPLQWAQRTLHSTLFLQYVWHAVEWFQTISADNILLYYFLPVGAGHWLAAFRKAEEEKYKNLHQRIKICRKCQNERAKCQTLQGAFLVSCWHQLRQRLVENTFIFSSSIIAGAALCWQTIWSLLCPHQWA